MYKLLKVGSDCELFICDIFGNPIPVIGLLGGTKVEPRAVMDGNGFSVQEDNVMAEFNIPPASDTTSFVNSLEKMLRFLSAHFHEKDLLKLNISPSCFFDEDQLDHPQAKTIGCEPDLCVWTKTKSKLSSDHPLLKTMRTSGGHLHISYTYNGQNPNVLPESITEDFVKMNDLLLGVPSVLLDSDHSRKQLYGKAGAFRYKEYTPEVSGHEYRVLSNFWISDPKLMGWTFDQVNECINHLNAGWISFDERELGLKVQHCINMNDKTLAEELCKEFSIRLP